MCNIVDWIVLFLSHTTVYMPGLSYIIKTSLNEVVERIRSVPLRKPYLCMYMSMCVCTYIHSVAINEFPKRKTNK